MVEIPFETFLLQVEVETPIATSPILSESPLLPRVDIKDIHL